VFLAVGLWWLLGARHKFTGPVRTVDLGDPSSPVVAPTGSAGSDPQ
jgi:hypothetical protein